MNKLWCTSFRGFEKIVKSWKGILPDNTAVISICEPEYKSFDQKDDLCWETHLLEGERVMNIEFYDLPEYEMGGYKGLTDEQGKMIYDFIKSNLGNDFYIHCSVGVSRSQGVVVWMLKTFPEYFSYESLNPNNLPEIPNKHVIDVLDKVLN